jgi:aryl-alcohol dehydrogenase-like predicted oxidoreductase
MYRSTVLNFRYLGNSGLLVSEFAFGAMTFGGSGPKAVGAVGLEDATAIVSRCIDAGLNLFDTADIYSAGESEVVLGKALAGRRDDVLVSTKMSGPMGDGPNQRGQSRQNIIRACEASLRRLGTDHIDVYQVHNIDEQTPMEETLGALDDLVRQGKVRYIGASNYSAWHLTKALGISAREHLERFVCLQTNYSLLTREVEFELVPASLDQGVGFVVWGPLVNGFLAGRQRRGGAKPEDTRRSDDRPFDLEQGYDVVEELLSIADARGVSAAQVALNWLRAKEVVSSVLIGARTMQQLDENLAAAQWELTDEELLRLDQVSAIPVQYPYWQQRRSKAARLKYNAAG